MSEPFDHVAGERHLFEIKDEEGRKTLSSCKVMECVGNGFISDDHLCIYKLKTEENNRRKGKAQKLLNEVLARFESDERNIYLWVHESNTAAISLYEKMGFNQTGRHYIDRSFITMVRSRKA